MPLPVLPANRPAAGSILAEGGEEGAALLRARRRFFQRLRDLRAAGLAGQVALALARARAGGDYVYLARTCGIPDGDAEKLDAMLEGELHRLLGDGPAPSTASQDLWSS